MVDIEVFTKAWCPYCWRAKALLKSKGLDYREVDITFDTRRSREMFERSQRRTVPQVFIDGRSIGGYDDLAHFSATSILDQMLADNAITQAPEQSLPTERKEVGP